MERSRGLKQRVLRQIYKALDTLCVLAVLAVSLVFLVGTGLAQYNPGAGIPVFSTQIGGQYDSVNLANGNVLITLPVRQKIGKMPFSASLAGNYGVYINSSSANAIWGVSTGVGLAVPALSTSLLYNVSSGSCNSQADTVYSQFAVADASGNAHPLPSSLKIDSLGCDPYPPPTQVTDGSGYTVEFTGYYNLITGISYSIYDKSGNNTSSQTGTTLSGGTGTSVADPDGVSMGMGSPAPVQGQPTVTTYEDTLGTTALTATTPWGDQQPTQYTYNDASGNPRSYGVSYYGYIVLTAFGCGIQEYNSVSPVLLPVSVSVPGGGTYTIAYEQTPGNSSAYTTGRIAKITLPSGGSISYQYLNGNNGINCTSGVVPKLTRTVNDNNGNSGTWTYINSNGNSPSTCAAGAGPCKYTVTETDPAGNQTVYYFSGEYQTAVWSYQGQSTGGYAGALRVTTTCYDGNFTTCQTPSAVPSLPIKQTDVYTWLGVVPQALTETIYDCATISPCYGNVAEIKRYDWGAGSPPSQSPLSDEIIRYGSYNGGPCNALPNHIQNEVCADQVTGAVLTSLATYSYTGNHPTTINHWVSGQSNYLTDNLVWNPNGTLQSAQDAAGNTTKFFYNGRAS